MVHAEAREMMVPSLPCTSLNQLLCFLELVLVAYLLAVQTARIGLDADELLATDGEAVGESGGGVSEGRGQGIDVLL